MKKWICSLILAAAVMLTLGIAVSALEVSLVSPDMQFAYKVNEDGVSATVTDYLGDGGDVVIPEKIGKYTVTAIGNHAFSEDWVYDYKLTSITFPSGITSIGDGAFSWCKKLTDISLPDSLVTIGHSAFYNCSGLTNVTFPDELSSIGDGAFEHCSELTNVIFGERLTSIGSYAFHGCSKLTNITFSEGLTSISGFAFHSCSGLTNITFPDELSSIGDCAFANCSGLTSVIFSEGLSSIGSDAFTGCSNLTDVYFWGNVPLSWGYVSYFHHYPVFPETVTIYYPEGNTSGWTSPTWTAPDGTVYNTATFVPEKKTENKAIIVVPGITGSELFTNTIGMGVKKIWIDINLTTLHGLLGELKCDEYGNSIYDVFSMDEASSPYGAFKTYENLVTDLKRYYEPEYDVRFFSYDWRLTNTLSAEKLHNFIEGNDYDEVILVAHSMGGIVSSLYIDKYGDSKIDKLITLGTPYYGSPKAFNALENGEFLDGLPKLIGIDNAVIKNIVPNMPGLYELLPSKGYYQNGNYFAEYRNNGLNYSQMMEQIYPICSWYNSLLINQANNIYESLNTTYNNIICGSTDTYVIVGYNTNTVTCYEYINIDGYDLGVSDLDINPAGDGTVPLISATLNFANFKRDPYYVDGINHTELASDGKCLQLVKNIINGNGDNDFGENNPESYNYNCEGAVCRDIEIIREKGWFKTTTKVIARCPVALEIYSKDGTLLGKITPDGIETDSEHFYDFYALGDNNETKIAYVDGDVDIVVTGTGDGTMDFAIEKYTGDELTSTVTYNDVPITETTIIETDSDLNKNAKLDLRENADADEQEILPDTLTVEAVLGDINGDNEVTPEDYNILSDYFSGQSADVTISSAAADLNDDGRVTRADAMILARYLAKWPGYAEKYFQ